jgi:hypothetical protein
MMRQWKRRGWSLSPELVEDLGQEAALVALTSKPGKGLGYARVVASTRGLIYVGKARSAFTVGEEAAKGTKRLGRRVGGEPMHVAPKVNLDSLPADHATPEDHVIAAADRELVAAIVALSRRHVVKLRGRDREAFDAMMRGERTDARLYDLRRRLEKDEEFRKLARELKPGWAPGAHIGR